MISSHPSPAPTETDDPGSEPSCARHNRSRSCLASVHRRVAWVVAAGAVLVAWHSAVAATLPSGFTESSIASGLSNPTAIEFAPDGRLFVCEQAGRLRVIKNGSLLATPFLTVTVDNTG